MTMIKAMRRSKYEVQVGARSNHIGLGRRSLRHQRLEKYLWSTAQSTSTLDLALLDLYMRLSFQLLSISRRGGSVFVQGQQLRGKLGSYKVLEQLSPDRYVWKAM